MIQPRLEGPNVAPSFGSAGSGAEISHSHQFAPLFGCGFRFAGSALARPERKELLEVRP